MGLKHKITGWRTSSLDIYRDAWWSYGGSVNTHPDMVCFFMERCGMAFDFWHYVSEGKITAAFFISEGKYPGLNVWREYPLSWDEVVIPVASEQRLILPFTCNRLSARNRGNVLNAFYYTGQKRQICLVRQQFSNKTIRKRNGELRHFLSVGGEQFRLQDLSAGEIAQLYVFLFRKRFGTTLKCHEPGKLEKILSDLKHLIAGNVLFFQGVPCAIDLVWSAPSENMVYFDVPGGGIDPAFLSISPGSMLMWLNINDARQRCIAENKEMVFSLGAYEEDWDYKLRWAHPAPTGKVLSL